MYTIERERLRKFLDTAGDVLRSVNRADLANEADELLGLVEVGAHIDEGDGDGR